MRRRAIKWGLGGALESVLILAVAMAVARSAAMNHDWSLLPPAGWWRYWWSFYFVFEPFMSGIALAGGLALAIERLRRRTPEVWGVGRWTWSVSCLVVAYRALGWLFIVVIWNLRQTGPTASAYTLWNNLMGNWANESSNSIPLALIPALITAWVAHALGTPSADGREWSGRVFCVLVLVWAVVVQIATRLTA